MKLSTAKEIVAKAYSEFVGFECTLPESELFSLAGSVKHIGWGAEELNAAFKARFTATEITSNSGKRLFI